jgi:acyl carrier protein
MSHTEVVAIIVEVLKKISPENVPVEITEQTRIVDELDIHSIKWVELIVELEDVFKIRIKNPSFEETVSVGDVAALVVSRLSEQNVA